jgi:hypothetical protein
MAFGAATGLDELDSIPERDLIKRALPTGGCRVSNVHLHERAARIDPGVVPHDQPTEYEQLVALASRVDQLLRELEAWLHVRERVAATGGARGPEHAWRHRRLAIMRHSQALMAALLRDIEL